MAAKQSEETRQAIRLHEGGRPVYEAAAMAGIYPSTLYRALEAKGLKAKGKKKLDRGVALRNTKAT